MCEPVISISSDGRRHKVNHEAFGETKERFELTDVGVNEARHEVLERQRVEIEDVAEAATRVAMHRASEIVHDLL